jgi:hypothetical protein
LAAGVAYGMRLLFLESGKERFARGIYRDEQHRF